MDQDPELAAAIAVGMPAETHSPLILPLGLRAPRHAPAAHADPIFIRDRSGYQRLCRSTIRTLRADGNYVELHTGDRRFVLRTSLRELIQQLGEDRFVQVNRNTAVNTDHLDRVDQDSVEVEGVAITLSRSYRTALLEHLHVLCGR